MNQSQAPVKSNASVSWMSFLPALLVVGCGVFFSWVVYAEIVSWENTASSKAFQKAAEDRAWSIKASFETELAMLQMVRAALMADGRIDRHEFHEVLLPFLAKSSDVMSVEWVPRVPENRRIEFEVAARQDGIKDFQFTVQNAKGDIVPAPKKSEYYPIFYMGPQQTTNIAYGYDLSSEPVRWEALQLSRDSGNTVASGQITFLKEEEEEGGFFVCLPLYEQGKPANNVEERRKNLKGFILGVFKPTDMIQSAVKGLQPEGIDFAIYDPTDVKNVKSFHYHASRMREDLMAPLNPKRLLDPKVDHFQLELGVAGHPWTVICSPTPAFQLAHQTWIPLGVLAAGLIFTAMIAGYLFMNIAYASRLERKVKQQTGEIRKAQEEVLYRLASASQWRDEESPMHLRRVGLMSRVLAGAGDWYGEEIEAIGQAATMLDIGVLGIPDAILKKTEPLTPEELNVLKTHTQIGAEILAGSNVPVLKMAHDIALFHHERWDGKGYPKGLVGDNIPECARIVAIVDAYDSLTHKTAERPPLSENEALNAMRQESAKVFDPVLLARFIRRLPEIHAIAEQFPDRIRVNTFSGSNISIPTTAAGLPDSTTETRI